MTTWVYAILLTVGLVMLVVTVVRVLFGGIASTSDQAMPGVNGGCAQRILDERYAAGELSSEEYQHRLRVLMEGN